MNIAWITVRRWDDLCSTTTDALVKGLVRKGHLLTVFNADQPDVHQKQPWSHVSLLQSNLPGRKGASLARSALKWFQINHDSKFDVVMVDWPLASPLAKFLFARGERLVLMDRSPPADSSYLAKLQWRVWRKAWSLVKRNIISEGLVVSDAHKTFVMNRCRIPSKKLHCIPAGVNLELFPHEEKVFDGVWNFVYHGRLDKNRGVLALPMLMRKLQEQGFNVRLSLVGKGDAVSSLKMIASNDPQISVQSRLSRTAMAQHLSKQHIGLLPMPNTKVWSMASPLKRSEYLAAGLFVYGIDHRGHRLEGINTDWFRLSAQEDFHDGAVAWMKELSQLTHESYLEGVRSTRAYAEEFCAWDTSLHDLESVLISCIAD